jgi:hypothetical protein
MQRRGEVARDNRQVTEMLESERRPVTFSVAELWLLHDFIRHELPDLRSWRYPPASEELNDEIALALDACEAHGLTEYTLLLSRGDLLTIDFFVRRDHKTPEGASGKKLLLKVFQARRELYSGLVGQDDAEDRTYKEVKEHAPADFDSGKNAG